jgi:hypothetical protein
MSNKRYIIMTSASEYVLAIGHEGMQTTSSVREATILDKPQAESLLRTMLIRLTPNDTSY